MTAPTGDAATARCGPRSWQPLRSLLWVLLPIALIWQLPHGRTLLYPLSLLATCAHELGHGFTALLLGARFESFALHADGSGLALWRGSPGRVHSALTAAILCLSWLQDVGYMFSASASIDGLPHASDTAIIAQALWLPYWFWGGVIATVSLAILALGLWFAVRPSRL
jgi:hypothetical protein